MAAPSQNPALRRLLRSSGHTAAFDLLSRGLSGSELTTFLLGVFQQRVRGRSTFDVLQQYENDRFVSTAPVSGLALARLEAASLEVAEAQGFASVGLAPVAPLGLHHVLGATPQNNVISTSRGTEVTADPTNSLAIDAARRRSKFLDDPGRRSQIVHLAAAHRVTRAQHFSGPRSFAHFSLLGLASAGRDRGDLRFEVAMVAHHLRVLIDVVRTHTAAPIQVALSPFNRALGPACDQLAATLEADAVDASVWLEREHARNYYRNICFKLSVDLNGEIFELGDGGDVWWMQELLQSRKERLVIGGLGLERLALLQKEHS